jgi:hypothetical protein
MGQREGWRAKLHLPVTIATEGETRSLRSKAHVIRWRMPPACDCIGWLSIRSFHIASSHLNECDDVPQKAMIKVRLEVDPIIGLLQEVTDFVRDVGLEL